MKKRFSKGCEDISGSYWWVFLNGAKKRNIEVKINIEYLWELYLKQDKKCLLSGIPLSLDIFCRDKEKLIDGYDFASLDRIDNSKGYIEGNVRWISRKINYMKWKFSDEQFLFFVKKIIDNYENRY